MNEALELHDSTVESVQREGGVLRVSLRTAYVHRSSGRPGVDSGEGYAQAVDLLFSEARVEVHGACVGVLSSGSISCDGRTSDNLVPLPLSQAGNIQATFEFASGGVLRVLAIACASSEKGEARFVEKYEG
jgi:hypothetical protein